MSFRFFKNKRCGIIEATENEKMIEMFKKSESYEEVENPLAAKKAPAKVAEPEAPKPTAKKTSSKKKAAKK